MIKQAPTSASLAAFEAHVTSDARTWAAEWASKLRSEQRGAVGGWPGTLSEARARVNALASRAALVLGESQREACVKQSYAAARQAWLATSRNDDQP